MPMGAPERETALDRHSILFAEDSELDSDFEARGAPEFFSDLNLDQIVESITAGRDEYNLKPFFHTPLRRVESINYRYDVFRDLENESIFGYVQAFAQDMRTVRGHLTQVGKLYYARQKQSWFLDAVEMYCGAVRRLAAQFASANLTSRGLLGIQSYLSGYVESSDFNSLASETQKLKEDLSGIMYSLFIEGKRIHVSRYGGEPDYGADVLDTFEKFKQGAPKEYSFKFPSTVDMNHVEAAILDLVARWYPEVFSALEAHYVHHRDYIDSTVARFDREVQFYVACLEHLGGIKRAGLPVCHPTVTDRSKEINGNDVFDLALANRLIRENRPVVQNDFFLQDPERIIVVSGPNQGGKTTFARVFGQLHYLAAIGCPVPGSEARLFLFDEMFTHFEREEDIQNLSGKLEDDLLRIHRILESATPRSVLIMNESFLSTTLNDALFLSKQIMERVIELDMLCVSVTFLDEMASFGRTTVSMVSTVNPTDPAQRTFKVVRKRADGLAYAVAIAEKYHLTYDGVKERIAAGAKERVAS